MQQKSRNGSIKIFVAYVNEDETYLEHIDKLLKSLKFQGHKISWEESRVTAGMDWKQEDRNRLDEADLILLLVSLDFLASEHSKGRPVEHAVKRHAAEEAWVIPVIVRPCIWNRTKFAKLKPLPEGGRPITDWPSIDHALKNIGEGVIEAVEHLLRKTPKILQNREPPPGGNITQFPKNHSK